MTTITISKDHIFITGHAQAERVNGEDLCCAAISALTENLFAGAENFTDDDVDINMDAGDCGMAWNYPPSEKLGVLIDSFALSAFRIGQTYPDNCRVLIEQQPHNYISI